MSSPLPPTRTGRWRAAMRLLWAGQSVSLVGDQVTLLAVPLAALALGAGPARVAMLAASASAPFIVFGLPAGVWVARFGLRRSMMCADVARGLALLSLPVSASIGRLGYPQLLTVALVVGTATVFFQISYQSLTPVLVDKPEQLRSANTRLGASESLAQIAGPAFGGTLIGVLGAVRALSVDAFSYAISVATLVALHAPGDRPVRVTGSATAQMRYGLRQVRREPALLAVLAASVWFNAGMAGYQALLVVFAVKTLGLSASTLGVAVGVGGLGVPAGLLISEIAEHRFGTPAVLVASAGASAAGLLIAAASAGAWAVVAIGAGTFVTAVGGGAWSVTALTTRQRLTTSENRAMATAVFRWATYSASPVGALAAGGMAAAFGVRTAVILFAAFAQLCVLPLLRARLPDFRTDITEESSNDQSRRHHRQHTPGPRRWSHRPVGCGTSTDQAGRER